MCTEVRSTPPELLDTGTPPSASEQLKRVTLAPGEPGVILPPELFDTGAEMNAYQKWFMWIVLSLLAGTGVIARVYRGKLKS